MAIPFPHSAHMSKPTTSGQSPAPLRLLLAHGAGAGMSSPFMETLAAELGRCGVVSTRFEFDYMAKSRRDGVRRPPPKMARLADEMREQVAGLPLAPGQPLLIGGKSMGGRVASLIADDLHRAHAVIGLVCLGYPFHPPRKPAALRTAHLASLACPALIVQGERDPFGTPPEVAGYGLPSTIALHWLPDGDHDLMPRRSSGHTQSAHIAAAAAAIASFGRALAQLQ
jgi:uncharacterized protein